MKYSIYSKCLNTSSFYYKDVFNIEIGKSIDLNKLKKNKSGINYVGRTELNNGITAKVNPLKNTVIYEGGCLTVPMVGNAMKSSYQEESFCVSQNIAILRPKYFSLNEQRAIFFNVLIRKDIFRFSYGRTLSLGRLEMLKLLLPVKDGLVDIDYIDEYVKNIYIKFNIPTSLSTLKNKVINNTSFSLNTSSWIWYEFRQIFELKKGKRLTKANMKKGSTPYIAAIDSNNGYRQYIEQSPIHKANTITVSYNGSVAEAYYQPRAFWATDDVNVLYPKFKLNPYIALFLCTLIKKEKYRFNYGRKWHLERMQTSKIKLPSTVDGKPDFKFMEEYIKSLPFSRGI